MRKPFWKRMAEDESGAITVEFVIWVPILVFWLVGSIAFYDAYRDRGRAEKASHVISDIVSRQVEMTPEFVTSLHDLLDTLLADMPNGKWVRITSVIYDDDKHEVQWSEATGSGLAMRNEDIPKEKLPDMGEGDTVILVETFVPYDPILGWTGIGTSTLARMVPIRPRYAPKIVMLYDS